MALVSGSHSSSFSCGLDKVAWVVSMVDDTSGSSSAKGSSLIVIRASASLAELERRSAQTKGYLEWLEIATHYL